MPGTYVCMHCLVFAYSTLTGFDDKTMEHFSLYLLLLLSACTLCTLSAHLMHPPTPMFDTALCPNTHFPKQHQHSESSCIDTFRYLEKLSGNPVVPVPVIYHVFLLYYIYHIYYLWSLVFNGSELTLTCNTIMEHNNE